MMSKSRGRRPEPLYPVGGGPGIDFRLTHELIEVPGEGDYLLAVAEEPGAISLTHGAGIVPRLFIILNK